MEKPDNNFLANLRLKVIYIFGSPSEHEEYYFQCIRSGKVPESRVEKVRLDEQEEKIIINESYISKFLHYFRCIFSSSSTPDLYNSAIVVFLYNPDEPLTVYVHTDWLYQDGVFEPYILDMDFIYLDSPPEWINMDLKDYDLNNLY